MRGTDCVYQLFGNAQLGRVTTESSFVLYTIIATNLGHFSYQYVSALRANAQPEKRLIRIS